MTNAEQNSIQTPAIAADPPAAPHVAADRTYDLYKLAVEMADRVSARRASANTFFLTLETAIAGVLSAENVRWYLAVAGIALSAVWWLLLRSYRDLNRAKYTVILKLEQSLPVGVFSAEWDELKPKPVKFGVTAAGVRLARYRELGSLERIVPVVFIVIYCVDILRQAVK